MTTLCLITGASGFIGSELSRAMNSSKYSNLNLVPRCAVRSKNLCLNKDLDYVVVPEVSADTNWQSALLNVDVVVHLAGRAHIVDDKKIEGIFAASQIAILGITIISISYSYYLIDLTLAFMFSTAYFVVAKIYAEVEKGAYRGNKKFSKAAITDNTICHVICIDVTQTKPSLLNTLKRELELKFGFSNVFYLDNVFGDGNLIEDLSETYHFFVYFAAANETTPTNQNEIQTGLTFVSSNKTETLQKQTHYLAFHFHKKSLDTDDQIVFSDVALTMLKLVRFNLKNK